MDLQKFFFVVQLFSRRSQTNKLSVISCTALYIPRTLQTDFMHCLKNIMSESELNQI